TFVLLSLIWICSLIAALTHPAMPPSGFVIAMFTCYALHLVFKCMVAAEATRQLSADKHSGALELLLVSPLPEWQILQGQSRALSQRFGRWLAILVMMNLTMSGAVIFFKEELHIGRGEDLVLYLALLFGGILMLVLDLAT